MKVITTLEAPKAIGIYSQAIQSGDTVYLSGQIPLVPETMELVSDDFIDQTRQVFKNIKAVCEASGGSLADIVKLNVYVLDLANFADLNSVMEEFFTKPYPARAAIGINQLPKNSKVEIDGIMVLKK